MNLTNTWPTFPKSNSDVPADLEGALGELGVRITEITETDIVGYCPWHDEGTSDQKKPKWAMLTEGYTHQHTGEYIKPGMHNCFSCQFKGDFRYLVMKLLNCDEVEADSWIAQHKVINLDRAKEKLNKPNSVKKQPLTIIHESMLGAFQEVPDSFLLMRNISRQVVNRYGIRWDGEHYIIPIRQTNGHLLGWQKKNAKYFMNVPKHMQFHHTLFGLEQAQKDQAVVLVESPLDVLYLWDNGINAVATYGKNVSEAQMQLVIDNFLVVKVALDQDAKKESLALKHRFSYRIPMWFFNYEGLVGNDPGECSPQELTKGIGNAIFSIYYE